MKLANDISFRLIKHIGVIEEKANDFQLELNVIEWNCTGIPKYDIRSFSKDHSRMTKGMTFTAEELEKLYEIMKDFDFDSFDEICKKEPTILSAGDSDIFGCAIYKKIGVIGITEAGWKKEIRIAKWGNLESSLPIRFDIRMWGPDESISRGLTPTPSEMKNLVALYKKEIAEKK